ncbi:uncharacterized protein EpC_11730 [Erwinia pyrifoliae Ep1/96]|nr:uncharacterized protein EpC_11730 [Erwinia pyrifoliae Ep1/96]
MLARTRQGNIKATPPSIRLTDPVNATLLKAIAQAVTGLDNKTAHRQPPVLDRHTPFLSTLDRQINNLSHRVVCRKHLSLFHGCADHAVQRLNGVCGVDSLADIWRIAEELMKTFTVVIPKHARNLICIGGRPNLLFMLIPFSVDCCKSKVANNLLFLLAWVCTSRGIFSCQPRQLSGFLQ